MAIEFTEQCCDAIQYLHLGKQCELEGLCYDNLRPMGALIWFAIPGWIGLPQEFLIIVNLFLIFISTVLLAYVIKRFSELLWQSQKLGTVHCVAIFLSSAVAHGVFFLPLWNTSLTDTPSALFCLMGISCLLLSGMRGSISAWLNGCAGILIGMAVWLRAFYLYPFLLLLAATAAIWLAAPRRRIGLLSIFLGLIPVLIQFEKTYEHLGYWSFISREMAESWTDVHLNNLNKGYDTLLPQKGYPWESGCNPARGPWAALMSGHYQDAACFYLGKLHYYLGSYSSKSYIFHNNQGLLIWPEDIGIAPYWRETNVLVKNDCERAPKGGNLAEEISILTPRTRTGSHVVSWTDVYKSGPYVFSVYLWSPTRQYVDIAILSPITNVILAQRTVRLSKKPKRYSLSGYHEKSADKSTSELGVLIGKLPGTKANFGRGNDAFYAWGAKLENSSEMTPFDSQTNRIFRYWSKVLLILNLLLSALTLLQIIKGRFIIGLEGKAASLFVFASFCVGLIIAPEQRFIVLFHVLIWAFGLSYLLLLLKFQSLKLRARFSSVVR